LKQNGERGKNRYNGTKKKYYKKGFEIINKKRKKNKLYIYKFIFVYILSNFLLSLIKTNPKTMGEEKEKEA
jgi:hypothetical protein